MFAMNEGQEITAVKKKKIQRPKEIVQPKISRT